jgi:selenide,water dikinase
MRHIRESFPQKDFPKLLVGLEHLDDAAVYQITDELSIILTLDFFPPVVDDAYQYGAIAATNAMSDVYAMGGDVVLALNIAGFPPDLPAEIKAEIIRGGAEKVREAGGAVAGGHTVDDDEPKYGMVVMGVAHPGKIITNGGALPGDILVLTKPLGVGIVTTVLKAGEAKDDHVRAATESMLLLNKRSSELFREVGVSALTDISGFGLIGHALEMAQNSGVRLRFAVERLPFLPGAEEYADMWLFPAGTCNNERSFANDVTTGSDVADEIIQLLYTPETSGGLLASVPPEKVERVVDRFREEKQNCWIVGEVTAGNGVEIAKKK